MILNVFQNGNLKDCLTKLLNLLIHLIIVLFQQKSYIGKKTRAKLDRSCLKQDKIKFTHGKTVNIYIVYELSFSNRGYDDYPVL